MAPFLLHALGELLAPRRCLACRRRASPPWCEVCAAEARPLPVGCPRCAAPRGVEHRCWPDGAPVDATVAVYDYRGVVAAAVVTAKLTGAHAAWPALGARLADRVATVPLDVDVVSWVTTAPTRRRARGVDHAEVLARAVAARLGVPLRRLLDAHPHRSGRDAYRVRHALPGSHVLLVDDVLTTGTTAARAASALKAAGAGDVRLAVFARAGAHVLLGPGRAGPTR